MTDSVAQSFPRMTDALFRAAMDLACVNGLSRAEPAHEGRGGSVTTRTLGRFEFRLDYHLCVRENLNRHAVQVWYENALVFCAWSSAVAGQTVTCVVVETRGIWRYHLRLRHLELLRQRSDSLPVH